MKTLLDQKHFINATHLPYTNGKLILNVTEATYFATAEMCYIRYLYTGVDLTRTT